MITLSLLHEEGTPVAIASFAKNISDLKAAERELRALNETLEKRVSERTAALQRSLDVARERAEQAAREDAWVVQGKSIAARALRESIEHFASRHDPLCLTGPSGSGQLAVARMIHHQSKRAPQPFIYVDAHHLGNLETDTVLLEKTQLAHGGTLYMEHLPSLPLRSQELLVELTSSPQVRLITYFEGDLQASVRQGHLAPQLASLLTSVLRLPTLAERRDDLEALAQSHLARVARTHGKIVEGLTPAALKQLRAYAWPGNLRELAGVLERAVLLSSSAHVHLDERLLGAGPRVGGYRLTRKLGAGGMGEVWQARHDFLARPAAVKLIRVNRASDAQRHGHLVQRFQREAQAIAQLRSPHTVELYDFGVNEDNDFYFVMEYLEGMDLHRMIARHGPIPPARVVHLLIQACLSLGEAHAQGMVHRDIKPGNLFVGRMGVQEDFLKVLDFGIVKSMHPSTELTGLGATPGTPGFIAPELVHNDQITPLVDIYALGCVAFWALTGEKVFHSSNPMGVIVQHLERAPRAPSEVLDVPEDLDRLVLECLDKRPEARPASALELYDRLQGLEIPPWTRDQARAWWNTHHPHVGNLAPEVTTVPLLSPTAG